MKLEYRTEQAKKYMSIEDATKIATEVVNFFSTRDRGCPDLEIKVEEGSNHDCAVVPINAHKEFSSHTIFGAGAECGMKYAAFQKARTILGFSGAVSWETVLRCCEALRHQEVLQVWATILVCPEVF